MMSRTSSLHVDLAVFTQFFAIFSFFSDPINLKALDVFYIFQRVIHIFKDDFTNCRAIPEQKALFSNSRSFPGPRSNSRTFPGQCKPCFCSSLSDQIFRGIIHSPPVLKGLFYTLHTSESGRVEISKICDKNAPVSPS